MLISRKILGAHLLFGCSKFSVFTEPKIFLGIQLAEKILSVHFTEKLLVVHLARKILCVQITAKFFCVH